MNIDNRVSGKTRFIGLIGNPVEHSISPQLHNSLSSFLGVDVVYIPFHVEKNALENAVKGLKALNVLGFNVTVPYKRDIMKYIDDNIKEALWMGSINTVKNIDGRFYGYNTDAEGFLRSFKQEAGTGFKDKNVVIIGAGGVARPLAVKIALEGARKINLVNRTASKASDIAELVNENIREIVQIYNIGDKTFEIAFGESDIIINTTSVGMYPDVDQSPLGEFNYFSSSQIVYDVIYNPVKTKFLQEAEKKGCKTINGLGMLFYQGIYAFEIWTGVKVTEPVMKEVYDGFMGILK